MVKLFLLADTNNKFQLYADGDLVNADIPGFHVTKIHLEANDKTVSLALDSVVSTGFVLPARLLKEFDPGVFRLASRTELAELAGDEWSALRERARQRMAQPFVIKLSDANQNLFGVRASGTATLTASCLVSPAILDGLEGIALDDWIFKLRAVGELKFSYALKDYKATALLDGRLNLDLVVRRRKLEDIASAVMAALDVDMPAFPGFDLKLHAIPLPNLSLDGLRFDLPPDWFPSLFDTALPSFGADVQFALTVPPNFDIVVSGGQLKITTAQSGAGEFQFKKADGSVEKMLGVADLTLQLDQGRLNFTATIEPYTTTYTRDNVVIDKPWLPFLLQVEQLKVVTEIAAIDVANPKFPAVTVKYELTRLNIASRTEPDLFITLDLQLETTSNDGVLATRLTALEVVAPYPLELIKKGAGYFANAVGQLIRLVGPIALPALDAPDTDPFKRLLAHLGRMLASAIAWLARQSGAAAGMLAGLLESVAKALGNLIDTLAKAGAQAFSHVIIEVRLDPRTYQLRQIILQPTGWKAFDLNFDLSALGFDVLVAAKLAPSLVIDFGPDQWFGLVVQPEPGAAITLGTDLWLSRETGPSQPVGTVDDPKIAAKGRLIQISATPGTYAPGGGAVAHELVVIAIQRGSLRLFQKIQSPVLQAAPTQIKLPIGANAPVISLSQSGPLVDATIGADASNDLVVSYSADVEALKKRVLALMPKADTDSAPQSGGGVLDQLKQKIEIIDVTPKLGFAKRTLDIAFGIKVHLDPNFAPVTSLTTSVDFNGLAVKLTGGDRIKIMGRGKKSYTPFGMELLVRPQKEDLPDTEEYEQFYLDLAHGGESMGLGPQAVAELSYGSVSSSGKGLQFKVPVFRVGRGGIDLEAHIKPDPVTLGGVDVPFKFDAGHIAISGSRFSGGSLTGSGQLPQSLIGEANASIALTLAGRHNTIVVEAATARIDKSGDPIRCTSTRFDLTITELGFDFVREGDGYHFFFQVTGSASFNPGKGEFTSGLLKHFGGVEIKLDKAPVAADPRVLMRAMSFKVKVDPVKTIKAFDIFSFELRSFGYHPASPAFGGDPAISIGGKINFMKSGDKYSARMDFHDLWCSYGDGKPRFRCDGLTVGLALGGVKVEGTAITVDGSLPSLYKADVLPANVTAHGFLASGRIEFPGWSPMTAAMGFLELRNKNDKDSAPRHAFFIYGQLEKQTEPIDTPVGRIYLREYGFGFGYRYTLASIAQAETARSPNELIQILDEVSKYQGSLDRFEAWQPTYDADLTFALRGMFSMAAASERGSYNDDKEKDLPNPLLLDIVAALRTDLTFLINVRAWIAVNYHDWTTAAPGDAWRTNPTMRGYLYFSVPRKEFLGRFIANKAGHIGIHPKLPSQLIDAIRGTDFSATLYIRPGLFHFEMGWPYELGFELGKPSDNFYMKLNGGLIHRMEDFSVLYGMAFRAVGAVHLEGRFGSSSFGAAAVAHADFAIEAKILAFLSLRSPSDSMFYGELRIDVTIQVSVEVWLSFKVFGHRVHLSAGFALYLAVSIALEAVLSASGGLGGRAHASVGVRAFGRSASIGIGFSFNSGVLAEARARVARYSAMGLSAPVPDRSGDGSRVETSPQPQPPRSEVAAIGDQIIDKDIATMPPEAEAANDDEVPCGRPIVHTDFWAMLFPTAAPDKQDGEWYVMQIVPRDHTTLDPAKAKVKAVDWEKAPASFYTSPRAGGEAVTHDVTAEVAPGPGAIIVPALWDDCGKALDLNVPKQWVASFAVNLKGVVQAPDPGRGSDKVTIETLLKGLFLECEDDGTQTRPFGEPRPRHISDGLDTLNADREASARQLARSGRTRANLPALAKREAEIEESRSAVLAAVVDSAAKLAVQGVAGGIWPQRHAEIDARDFGLTFLLNREAVHQLFEDLGEQVPRRGRFSVAKSDAGGDGSVLLFNPPERMFREAQPAFAPAHKIEPQGIKLDWDLEPSWGNSMGVYHDPEFHLKHYRIVRTIEGIGERRFRAEFLVKAAAPVTITEGLHTIGATYMRPPFQFVDDLRKQGSAWNERGEENIPQAIRDVLLGQGNLKLWNQETDTTDPALVRIDYQIVAVDVAGTSDFGRPYSVAGFAVAKPRPLSPREVNLQLLYSRLPEFPDRQERPELHLLTRPGIVTVNSKDEVQWPEPNQVFQLRILSEPARATGAYGTDAIDAAGRRLDERAIDSLRGSDVADFLLVVKERLPATETKPGQLVSEYVPDGEAPGKDSLRRYSLEVRRVSGGALASASMESIANVLGANFEKVGLTHRLFLRKLDFQRSATNPLPPLALLEQKVHGEWRTMNANIVVADTKKTYISAMVEEFEQPVDVAFRALTHSDMVHGESGRLHIIQPGAAADLSMLIEAGKDSTINPFQTVRDRTRRTASRLTWKARPEHLQLTDPTPAPHPVPNLFRWVGGFDLHRVDVDGVPKGADLAQLATPLGRVSLLPPSLAGLEQEGFGDFGNLESAYPSDTLRQLKAPSGSGASGVRQAAWFSLADSTALFPQPAIRRSLMADPDEDMLAALFAGGVPSVIRISIPAWNQKHADPLAAWSIRRAESAAGSLPPHEALDDAFAKGSPNSPARPKAAHFAFSTAKAVRITVALVRDLLQSLCLAPEETSFAEAYQQEETALQQRIDDPRHLAAVKVKVEALYSADWDAAPAVLAVTSAQEVLVDLAPPLHPVLADTLALLAYAPLTDGGNGPGQVYRRYSMVPDAVPETTARSFGEWLDQAPPERDPHGWGALRTLGLAHGFRLYDPELGEYVKGHKLLAAVNKEMGRALDRYRDLDGLGGQRRYNGQAFADLLTRPWGNAKLFWFDGGYRDPNPQERGDLVGKELMAVMQIALRPAPDRLAMGSGNASRRPLVQYFELMLDEDAPPEIANWSVALKPLALNTAPQMRFDVLASAETLVANHPQRLSEATPYQLRTLPDKKVRMAVVRAIRIAPGDDSPLDLAEAALELRRSVLVEQKEVVTEFRFRLKELPLAVLNLKQDQLAVGDPAFGKFDALAGEDWADALFRPVGGAQTYTVAPVVAYKALSYYAGRRFGRLTVKQGAVVREDGISIEAAEARQERAEVAAALARFWLRFIEHCAPYAACKGALYFSLGTVADPGQWRCAPDVEGNISVLIPDMSRRGARRKFAVRPVGRYESWVKAASDGFEREPTLKDALLPGDVGAAEQFFDLTLPRTEPLEKPVVLSAVRHLPANGDASGRLELVIAHGLDMVLGQANARNDAQLAPLDLSVGYWREFAHRDWLRDLAALASHTGVTFDALAPFGSIAPVVPDHIFPPLDVDTASSRLVELRGRVPDAWMGATMVTAVPPPYFFRVHALLHFAAGIVLSEQTGISFEEGASTLRFAHLDDGYAARTLAAAPFYEVLRDGDKEDLVLLLDLPAVRFIDCMHEDEAVMWFGAGGEHWESIRPVAHLPEPGVSYRISVETALASGPANARVYEPLARQTEIDLLPAPTPPAAKTPDGAPPPPHQGLYLARRSGARLRLSPNEVVAGAVRVDPAPAPKTDALEWRIRLRVFVDTLALPQSLSAPLNPAWSDALEKALVALPIPAKLARAIDGLRVVTLTKASKAGDWPAVWEPLMVLLRQNGEELAPEALDGLLAWAVQPDPGAVLELALPVHLIEPAKPLLAALCGADPVLDWGAGIQRVVLRRAPADTELALISQDSTELGAWLYELAQQQLFDEGRRLVLSAMKGALRPITSDIGRKQLP